MVEKADTVQAFLTEVKSLLDLENRCKINDEPWVRKVNKTRQYMAETGIKLSDIKNVIRELEIENYSATKSDHNVNFPNELIWEFGITKAMVDTEEDLYIKLKIRKVGQNHLVIMSFHPEQPANESDKLVFPYKDYTKDNK